MPWDCSADSALPCCGACREIHDTYRDALTEGFSNKWQGKMEVARPTRAILTGKAFGKDSTILRSQAGLTMHATQAAHYQG